MFLYCNNNEFCAQRSEILILGRVGGRLKGVILWQVTSDQRFALSLRCGDEWRSLVASSATLEGRFFDTFTLRKQMISLNLMINKF